MSTTTAHSTSSRLMLTGIAWDTYQSLRDAEQNRNVRMTFDRGVLTMMSPSRLHERLSYLVGRLIDVWTEEHAIDVQSCRTMTCRREDLQRGFEPDNCYYVAHEAAVRDKDELDLSVDPPPDLAIEIDLTSSAVDKLEIYAAFGVPEVWRYDGSTLHVYQFNVDRYESRGASAVFPGLPLERVSQFLSSPRATSETRLVRSFRQWVRSRNQSHE